MTSSSFSDMNKWLREYEKVRTGGVPSESWQSSKYDVSQGWSTLKNIYVPELSMKFGSAVSALKKSWQNYKISGREGAYRGDLAYRINKIQEALGLELTEFDGYPYVKEQEDQQEQEDAEEWSLRQEELEEITPQTKEERELLEEEKREASDDWDSW